MTDLFCRAIARVRTLSPEIQYEAARMLLRFAGEEEPVTQLTPEQEADLREADAEIATDQEVQAIFAK